MFPFSPKARRFIKTDPQQDKWITILNGSVRSGKTWAMNQKIIFQMLKYRVPGMRVLLGKSKSTVYDNVLRDLFEFAGAENVDFHVQSGKLTLFGQEWKVIGIKDKGSEEYLRGKTIGLAVVDEATLMPEAAWNQLLARMSPDGARLYATTNPDSPFHYLKEKFIDNEEMARDIAVEDYFLDDNLSLSEEKKDQYRRSYSGVFYQRMINGLWVIAEGAIYGDCLGPQCEFSDETRPLGLYSSFGARYIGVDYGTTNPCVFLDVYDDGKVMWQDKEYYWDSKKQMKQKTDGEYADDLVKFIGPDRRGVMVVMDPSAASFRVECIKRGIPVKEADNDVSIGIMRTSSALKTGRYRINRERCPKTWKEAGGYAWDDKKAARGEEEPIKMHDHTCDAQRYVVHTMMPSWRVA